MAEGFPGLLLGGHSSRVHNKLASFVQLVNPGFGNTKNKGRSSAAPGQFVEVKGYCPIPKIYGAITSETIDISLIRMFIDGPEVSLKGSPTVSPVTDALCGSLFL